MPSKSERFQYEIYAIVIIKLLVIFGLWWLFFREVRLEVGGEQVASHFSAPAVPANIRHQGETHAQ